MRDEDGRLAYARQEEVQAGARQRELELAREMLKELDLETVSRVTGLLIAVLTGLQGDRPPA